jgi:hypothetical protein
MLYATEYSAQDKTSGAGNISVGSNKNAGKLHLTSNLSKVTAQRLLLVQRLEFRWTNELTSCEPTEVRIDNSITCLRGASWERLTSELSLAKSDRFWRRSL